MKNITCTKVLEVLYKDIIYVLLIDTQKCKYLLISYALNCTGCFYSTAVGGLRCYENPKNKITAVPAEEEEIWGATFKVTR